MKRHLYFTLILLVLVGCGGEPSPTPDSVATQVAQAQAVAATLTAAAPTQTPTAEPTASAAALDDAFLEALSIGCRPMREREQELSTQMPDGRVDPDAYCRWMDEYQRAHIKHSACCQMLPEPSDVTLSEARQWLQIAGEKWVWATTLASRACSGLESWSAVHPALEEAGMAGDKANGLLSLYFEQHPEDTPPDWQY